LNEGICDPSSSTTYSSSGQWRRKLSGPIPMMYRSETEVFQCPTLRMSSL
jgi:hypothetical protein